jgi:hypothetical protein
MNATRASWRRREYHNDTHTATVIIAVRVSIAATRAGGMQSAKFYQPAQEPWVVRLMQWCQLSSLSAWPTQAAQALQQWQPWQQSSPTTRRIPRAQGQGLQALPPTRRACQSLVALICTTKHANNNNNLQAAKKTHTQPPCHVHHTSGAGQLPDKQQIEMPGRASETVPMMTEQAQAMTTTNAIFLVIKNKE